MATTPVRYILIVLGVIVRTALALLHSSCLTPIQISLHYILSFSHEGYGNATSLSNIKEHIIGGGSNPPYKTPVPDEYYVPSANVTAPGRRANAAFVLLARNNDLPGVIQSMKQMEDRFNKKFGYPYIFLNEEPFTDDFKK
jgi:alpha 1,2-mannosyltransferase